MEGAFHYLKSRCGVITNFYQMQRVSVLEWNIFLQATVRCAVAQNWDAAAPVLLITSALNGY
jgi:hypothetical protein